MNGCHQWFGTQFHPHDIFGAAINAASTANTQSLVNNRLARFHFNGAAWADDVT
jgi:hypothetical protein